MEKKIKITEKQGIVIGEICDNPKASLGSMAKALGVTRTAAVHMVDALIRKGILKKVGKTTNIKYEILDPSFRRTNKITWFDHKLREIAPPEWRFNGTTRS